MSFNIGLSALNAAQEEIAVTGNNIANASTNGFKSSRTEFADVYAASILGGGARQQGGGVGLQAVAQNFAQGNISFTDNTLDLAINGGGFFILNSEIGNVYTRAGAFGTDKEGYIVNKMGERLQGFAATEDGKATGGGPLSDLRVSTGQLPPRATTQVTSALNLDAAAQPSSIIGSKVVSNKGNSGIPQLGGRIAREAQIVGRISTTGTDFSGTTSARTAGISNLHDGLAFTTVPGPHGFSISVNGGAYVNIDLAGADMATAEDVRAHVQAQLDAEPGLGAPNNVVATLENNRLVLTTAAQGASSRINISAVQGLASNLVSATDVIGKTAPPTGFRLTLDGVSRDIVINQNFSNTGSAALALGGGEGSGNEALEDYIQAQINSSSGLLGKVNVSIDSTGNITFKTTEAGQHNLQLNPLSSTVGSVNFDQIVEFSTNRRSGTLNLENLNFETDNTSFTITVGTESLVVTLNEDYSASGAPAAVLGELPESGIEALEDEIQRQINESTLPGAVKVSIAADGSFSFDITDPDEYDLRVESDSIPASVAGTLDVSHGFDFATTPYTFTVSYGIDGNPAVTSNPITINTVYSSAADLVSAIQAQIDAEFGFTPDNKEVQVVIDPQTGGLVIRTVATGPDANITVTGNNNAIAGGNGVGSGPALDFGTVASFDGDELNNNGGKAVSNGYDAEVIEVVNNEGKKQLVQVPAGASANAVAQLFSNVSGITAKATSVAFITATNRGDPENIGASDPSVEPNLPLRFSVNGLTFETNQTLQADRFTDLANQINSSTGNLTARVVSNAEGVPALEITENNGLDLVFSGGSNGRGSLTVAGSARDPATGEAIMAQSAASAQLANLGNLSNQAIVVGGVVDFTLDEGVTMVDARSGANGTDIPITQNSIFGNIDEPEALVGAQFELNTFDPTNPETYYRSTAIGVFDSLGNQHTLTQYFVKERATAENPSGSQWSVYFQIDGENIGYDPASVDGTPTMAKATLRFSSNGQYDPTQEDIYITNWTPRDVNGQPVGAGPVLGDSTVTDLLDNSNFRIDLSKLTQYGGDFAVDSNIQDGFAKGELTGLEIDTRGRISARFSNGESKILGEVALADFADPSKLANIGGTRFAETAESGAATRSGAGTAGLGLIQSGALEDSNVDLSEQLVQLIVSQRNYQAAAQIIESIDSATQTIINL